LDLTQIRYFLALARTLNFTRAAADCGVTQPGLSRGIQRLEETLGAPLVLRERSLTQLTEFGRAMLPLLQRTHDAAEAAMARAEERRREADEAPLRLGVCAFMAMGPLVAPIREVATRIPGARLEVRRGLAPVLLEGILQGSFDVIVGPVVGPLPDRLHSWRLWSLGIAAMLPESHALAADPGPLPIAALRDEPMVLFATDDYAPQMRARMRERYGLGDVRWHSAAAADEVTAMVAAGLGWATAPEDTPPAPGTRVRSLVTDPPVSLDVVMSVVAGRPMNRAVRHFHRLLLDRFAEMQAA